jgi:PTH1 family peptidyl-tRNA hydrolase
MFLIIGLGNPGPRYAENRHNIGFLALDEIVSRHGFSSWRQRFQGEMAEGTLGGDKVLALKPATFMNESGRSVGEALRFYKLAPEDVLVLHDELDLAPGKVKLKSGGGHAGHNGLRSIMAHIGPEFRRLRLGIGHPGHKDRVHGYVLSDFAKSEREGLARLLDSVAKEAQLLVRTDEKSAGAFMSKVNQAVLPPRPKRPKAQAAKPAAAQASPAEDPEDGGGALARALRQAAEKLGLKKDEKD